MAPIAFSVAALSDDQLEEQYRLNLILMTFRASFISSAACRYPAEDMNAAAYTAHIAYTNDIADAAYAAYAADFGNAVYAAYAARDVTYAARDAANAVDPSSIDMTDAARGALYAENTMYALVEERQIWNGIRADCLWLEQEESNAYFAEGNWAQNLMTLPLWIRINKHQKIINANRTNDSAEALQQFYRSKLSQETSFGTIIEWYILALEGRSAFGEEADIKLAQRSTGFWEGDPIEVMDRVAELVGWERQVEGEKSSRNKLANLASPQAVLNDEDRLDVAPNEHYDKPEVDNEIIELPIRQKALIRSLLEQLNAGRGNNNAAPRIVISALQEYQDELSARGTQPIIGIFKDQADIIEAEMNKTFATEEWCNGGVRKACEQFLENNEKIIEHYPLDKERDAEYAKYDLNESGLGTRELQSILKDVTEITRVAKNEGLTTDDFLKVFEKRMELQDLISTLPEDQSEEGSTSSLKKRWALGDVGILDKAGELAQKTDKIAKSEIGKALIKKTGEYAGYLWSLIS